MISCTSEKRMCGDKRPRHVDIGLTIGLVALLDIGGYLIITWSSFNFGGRLLPTLGIIGGIIGLIIYNHFRTYQ